MSLVYSDWKFKVTLYFVLQYHALTMALEQSSQTLKKQLHTKIPYTVTIE